MKGKILLLAVARYPLLPDTAAAPLPAPGASGAPPPPGHAATPVA